MFPPAVTTRSGQLLELSIKSDEILKFAICSHSFPCRPFAVFSDTSLRLFLCVRTGSKSASHADYIMTCENEILLSVNRTRGSPLNPLNPNIKIEIVIYCP